MIWRRRGARTFLENPSPALPSKRATPDAGDDLIQVSLQSIPVLTNSPVQDTIDDVTEKSIPELRDRGDRCEMEFFRASRGEGFFPGRIRKPVRESR